MTDNANTPTQSTYDALEAAYDALNSGIFGGALPPVMITLKRVRSPAGARYRKAEYMPTEGEESERVGSIALSPDMLTSERKTIAALALAMCDAAKDILGPGAYESAAGAYVDANEGPELAAREPAWTVWQGLASSGWCIEYAAQMAERKAQDTYMLKASCPHCGYLVRLTRKWAAVGLPDCPVHGTTLTLDDK